MPAQTRSYLVLREHPDGQITAQGAVLAIGQDAACRAALAASEALMADAQGDTPPVLAAVPAPKFSKYAAAMQLKKVTS